MLVRLSKFRQADIIFVKLICVKNLACLMFWIFHWALLGVPFYVSAWRNKKRFFCKRSHKALGVLYFLLCSLCAVSLLSEKSNKSWINFLSTFEGNYSTLRGCCNFVMIYGAGGDLNWLLPSNSKQSWIFRGSSSITICVLVVFTSPIRFARNGRNTQQLLNFLCTFRFIN